MTSQTQHAQKIEELLKDGCRKLTLEKQNGGKGNIKEMATRLKVSYTTLRARFLNVHKPRHEAHAAQQFLSPALELLLVKWIIHLGATGRPLCKWTIRLRAQHLHPENKKPGCNWIYLFLKRHPDIVLSAACGLDLKHAKAFNRPVVNCYFDELTNLVKSFNIPIENIYNMDEKGCQRGGGKNRRRRKLLYSRKQRAKYKHRSANLELITIIKAICADGTDLKPGFVFPGSSFSPEWFENHPDIMYKLISVFFFLTFCTDLLVSASQHLQTAGQMTSSVQNGLRNPSFPKLQHEILQGSLFFSFLMAMALMKRHASFNLPNSITLLFCAFHLIPPTNCSLSMLAYLVHCNEHGWTDAIILSNLLIQRCVKRISSTSTWKLGKHRLNPAPLSRHSKKVEFGLLIEQSSLTMIMHPVSHIQLRLEIFLRCPWTQMIQIWILTMTLTLKHIRLLSTDLHNQPRNLHLPCHHLPWQLVLPLPQLLTSVPAFPTPIRLPLHVIHNFTMTQSFLTIFVNSRCRCSSFQDTSKWSSLSYRMRSKKQISGMAGQANNVNLMLRQES